MGMVGALVLASTSLAGASVVVPRGIVAVPGNGDAQVSLAGGVPGEYAVTYVVSASPGAATCSDTVAGTEGLPAGARQLPFITPSCVVKGLSNGVAYTFTATAASQGSTSGPSVASNSVVPGTAGAPQHVRVVVRARRMNVSWQKNSLDTSYQVRVNGVVMCRSAAYSCALTGLGVGIVYRVVVVGVRGTAIATSHAVVVRA